MGAEIIGIQAQIRFRKSSRRGKLITQRSGTFFFFLFVGDGIQWKFMHIECVFIYTCPLDTCIYKIRRAVWTEANMAGLRCVASGTKSNREVAANERTNTQIQRGNKLMDYARYVRVTFVCTYTWPAERSASAQHVPALHFHPHLDGSSFYGRHIN